MVDYHLIMDLVPLVARMFFLDQIDIHLSAIQLVSNGSFTTLSLGGFVLKIKKTMEIFLKYEQCGFIEKLQCA